MGGVCKGERVNVADEGCYLGFDQRRQLGVFCVRLASSKDRDFGAWGEYEGDVEDVACLRLDVSEYAVEEDAVQQACPN